MKDFDKRAEEILGRVVKDLFTRQVAVELDSMQWARVTSLLHTAERQSRKNDDMDEAEVFHNIGEEIMNQIASALSDHKFGKKF